MDIFRSFIFCKNRFLEVYFLNFFFYETRFFRRIKSPQQPMFWSAHWSKVSTYDLNISNHFHPGLKLSEVSLTASLLHFVVLLTKKQQHLFLTNTPFRPFPRPSLLQMNLPFIDIPNEIITHPPRIEKSNIKGDFWSTLQIFALFFCIFCKVKNLARSILIHHF